MTREERFEHAIKCLPDYLQGAFKLSYWSLENKEDWSIFYDEDKNWVELQYKDTRDSILFGRIYT